MKIIIPMSGIGKRFVEAGYKDPKPLIIIEGKPIIEHIVNLFDIRRDQYVFICNDKHLNETNMRNELLRIVPGCTIYEVSVDNRKGPVDAVMQIAEKELLDSNVSEDNEGIIVSYCDYGTVWDYEAFKKDIKDRELDGAIPSYIGFHPHMLGSDNYAFIKESVEGNKYFLAIQEKKPFTDNKMNEYASNGTYYYKSGAILKKYFQMLIDKNISTNGEFYCSMVYNLMKEDGLKIGIFEIEKMLQWGTPKDLEEYLVWSNYFLNRKPDFNKGFIDKYDTTLVLPMAGAGSRFSKEGFLIPKPLLDVEGLPMIIQAVECLPKTTNKIFIGQEDHFKKYEIDKTITYFYPEAKIIGINYITDGQACTCELAFKEYDIPNEKPVLISACDNGVYYDMDKYQKLLDDDEVDIIIWSFSNNSTSKLYPHMYAWIYVDENDYIKDVSIKKAFTEYPNKYCIIGTMLFKKGKYFMEGLKDIYDNNNRTNGEFYVDNMIMPLVNMGYKVKIFDVTNYLCWGTPNDYKTYNYWKEYFVKDEPIVEPINEHLDNSINNYLCNNMKKVISFSLWGDNPTYNIGAIRNAEIAKDIYPDFECWFYIHRETVPSQIIEQLQKLDNVKIIFKEGDINICDAMMWRFQAIDDPHVEIMMSRDTDTRFWLREKLAVEEWLSSGKLFHIMRDHPQHGTEILGGMFGTRKIPEIPNWIDIINNYDKQNKYGYDQIFLRNFIYPLIKDRSIIHAKFHKYEENCLDFPIPYCNKYKFVGEYVYHDESRNQYYINELINSVK